MLSHFVMPQKFTTLTVWLAQVFIFFAVFARKQQSSL